MTYYNENDPKMAAWLRELIAEGHIPGGHVDERSIISVRPHELTKFSQQHFFAGVGGWAYALRLAGWDDDFPVRTGSCPCQPFSQAGKRRGEADERHLWPYFSDLIAFGEPAITFGEQVASPLGREWLAGIHADLENLGYEVGSADLCAAGCGAPHIRQRLYWMAHSQCIGRSSRSASKSRQEIWPALADDRSYASGMANAGHALRRTSCKPGQENQDSSDARSGFKIGRMADTDGGKPGNGGIQCGWQHGQQQENGSIAGRMEHPAGDRRGATADRIKRTGR